VARRGLRERKLTLRLGAGQAVDSLKLKERTSGELNEGTLKERRRGEPFVGEVVGQENMENGSTGLARE